MSVKQSKNQTNKLTNSTKTVTKKDNKDYYPNYEKVNGHLI